MDKVLPKIVELETIPLDYTIYNAGPPDILRRLLNLNQKKEEHKI